ncbi:MAG: hypothetical protein ACRDEA_01005 [Microcystaceae cyanobacterium]
MKSNLECFYRANRARRFYVCCTIVVLTGIIYLELTQNAWADFLALQSNCTLMNRKELMSQQHSSSLPTKIADAVLQNVSRRTQIAREKFSVIEASRKTWPDGCLGIAQSGEMCTQALVEGWRVVVSDGQKNWIYRTDGEGRVIRWEKG